MLSTRGTALQFTTITATLGGLTVGVQYRLQWWTSDLKHGVGVASGTFATTPAGSGPNTRGVTPESAWPKDVAPASPTRDLQKE